MAVVSEKDDSPRGRRGQPAPFTLTEEEKSVLLECRRNSIARGIPLGIATVIAIRFFVRSGRAPFHVQRWSTFYYTGGFLLSFMAGAGSYREKCFEKIMALENSRLKQQVIDRFSSQSPSIQQGGPPMSRPPRRTHEGPAGLSRRTHEEPAGGSRQVQQQYDSTEGDDRYYGPGSQELEVKSEDSSFLQLPNAPTEQTTPTTPKKSRTFDDIREENRHRHRQKVYAPAEGRPTATDDGDTWRQETASTSQPGQSRKVQYKNKYGDTEYKDQ